MAIKYLLPLLVGLPLLGSSDGLTDQQKNQVQQLINDTIKQKPELVIDAIMTYKKNQMAEYQKNAEANIDKYSKQIFDENNQLVLGNPKGTTTIVEFLDYNCGHCRKLSKTLKDMYSKNNDLKIVIKDLPIFGESSQIAAKAAYSASKQGKYKEFHYKILNTSKPVDQNTVLEMAKSLNLDTKLFASDLDAKATQDYLSKNLELAKNMSIMATPAMIINKNGKNVFIAGALPEEELSKIISQM